MLKDIERLEQEIDTFYDNVFASNELMRIIKEIADEVVSQNKVLHDQSALLETAIKRIAALPVESAVKSKSKTGKEPDNIPDKAADKTMDGDIELIKKALAKMIETQTQHSIALAKSQSDLSDKIAECKSAIPEIPEFPEIPQMLEPPQMPELPDFSEITEAVQAARNAGAENTELLHKISESLSGIQAQNKADSEELQKNISEDFSGALGKAQNEIFDNQKAARKELHENIRKDIYDIFGRMSEVNAELVEHTAQNIQNTENTALSEFVRKSEEFYRICYDIRTHQEENDRTNNALSEYVTEQMDKYSKRFVPVYVGMGLIVALIFILLVFGY